MELKVSGKITKVLPPQNGTTKSGTQWTKMTFVIDNGDQYNSTFAFEIWKDEKVRAFNEHHNIGDFVVVDFNVDCSYFNGKFYTNLKAWKVEKSDEPLDPQPLADNETDAQGEDKDEDDDFPF